MGIFFSDIRFTRVGTISILISRVAKSPKNYKRRKREASLGRIGLLHLGEGGGGEGAQ